MGSLIITGKLVQKFLPKQADTDKILKIIQRKVLKGTHLLVTVKEIKAGYLISPYLKDLYLYLAQNKFPSTKTAIHKVETLAEKNYCYIHFCSNYTSKRNSSINHTCNMCSQNYYIIPF